MRLSVTEPGGLFCGMHVGCGRPALITLRILHLILQQQGLLWTRVLGQLSPPTPLGLPLQLQVQRVQARASRLQVAKAVKGTVDHI